MIAHFQIAYDRNGAAMGRPWEVRLLKDDGTKQTLYVAKVICAAAVSFVHHPEADNINVAQAAAEGIAGGYVLDDAVLRIW